MSPRFFSHHLLVAVSFILPPTSADISTAVKLSTSPEVPLPATASLKEPLAIELTRISAGMHLGSEVTFYVGKITIGQPQQELMVLFDTSSGHVLVPHRICKSNACQRHHRYSPWQSRTAVDVNSQGKQLDTNNRLVKGKVAREVGTIGFTQADFGEGNASSVLVRDNVCLGPHGHLFPTCVDLTVLAAVTLDDVPFAALPFDGIVGLGLSNLAISPSAHFLMRLAEGSTGILPHFGLSYGANGGEIYFGGHNPARISRPIQWFPVDDPELGYWQVAIQAVRVGNKTVDACYSGCHGIVDTGASRLGVQASNMHKLEEALTKALVIAGGCQGPDLTFDLGAMVLTLNVDDYTTALCTTQLASLNLEEPEFKGVYVFGETVLRRYYAAFDWEEQRIGFAPSATPSHANLHVVAAASDSVQGVILV